MALKGWLLGSLFVLGSIQANADLLPGIHEGSNREAWFKKGCRLEIHAGLSPEGLNVVTIEDAWSHYAFWFDGGSQFMRVNKNIRLIVAPLEYRTWSSKKALFSSIRMKKESEHKSGQAHVTIILDDDGKPVSYSLKHEDENGKKYNIRCQFPVEEKTDQSGVVP